MDKNDTIITEAIDLLSTSMTQAAKHSGLRGYEAVYSAIIAAIELAGDDEKYLDEVLNEILFVRNERRAKAGQHDDHKTVQ